MGSRDIFINSRPIQEFEKLKKIFFHKNCHMTQGIFRISPDTKKLEKTIKEIKKGNISNQFFETPHMIASSIKIWINTIGFRDKKKQFKQFIRRKNTRHEKIFGYLDSEFIDENYFYMNFENIIETIGFEKKHDLYSLLELLNTVKCNEQINKMGAKNLGIMFAPVIFSFEELVSEENKIPCALLITQNMIENFPRIKRMKKIDGDSGQNEEEIVKMADLKRDLRVW